ncbi:LOW QUALITY PROTEIN: uncharacterized protein EMH_0071630 [Eimeria mitis]|uniref:Uncharacterized protein n=1 Tax=Eimeria mitis TaxID=44415 RepID=U6KLC1_9EIME|nr:LOW QUALITY PROTEIN: uncharacterized protein EMH_0071630 [Eimeria mitis]CDJ36253.1 hypothetical protein, conserved [Eimeria mitis]
MGVGRVAVPIAPSDSRPLRAAAAAAPVIVIKTRARSQPPPNKGTGNAVAFHSSLAPPNQKPVPILLRQAVLRPGEQTTTDNRRLSGNEWNCSHTKGLPMMVQTPHQPRQADTNGVALLGNPRDAHNPEAAAGTAVAPSMGLQHFIGHVRPRNEERSSMRPSSVARGTSQCALGKMTSERAQEPPLERSVHYAQRLNAGFEGTAAASIAAAAASAAAEAASTATQQQQHPLQQQQHPLQQKQHPLQQQQYLLQQQQQHHPLKSQQQHPPHPLHYRIQQQQQQQLYPVQHQQQQQPELPVPTRRSNLREEKEGRGRSPGWQPLVKVQRSPADPAAPTMLQQVMPAEASEGREPPGDFADFSRQGYTLGRGVDRLQVGGVAANASPVQTCPVLDPFAAAGQQQNRISPVLWGRSNAIGANGTPMVSPRSRERTSSLGTRRTAAGIGVYRQSPLLRGPERHFQRPPSMTAVTLKEEGRRGEHLAGHERLDRGGCMHSGSKEFFESPSLPSRHPTTQGKQADTTAEQRHQKLHEFAMWRRGRRISTASTEPSDAQNHPTMLLEGLAACMQAGQLKVHNERSKSHSVWRPVSTDSATSKREEGLGKGGPAELLPEEGQQLHPVQLPSASSSRLSSNNSVRPIEPCCPLQSAPRAALEAAGRRQHPPCRGPQQQLKAAISSSNSNNSWESWEPLLQPEATRSSLRNSAQEATRLGAEAASTAEASFFSRTKLPQQ